MLLLVLGVFLLSLCESIFILGLFVPTTVLLVLLGFIGVHQSANLTPLWLAACLGCSLGQGVSWYWGWRRPLESSILSPYFSDSLQQLRQRVEQTPVRSWFLSRTQVLGRNALPYLAGKNNRALKSSLPLILISAGLWASLYLGAGAVLAWGWLQVEPWVGQFAFFLLLLLFAGYTLAQIFHYGLFVALELFLRTRQWLTGGKLESWLQAKAQQHLKLSRWLQQRFDRELASGLVLTLGLICLSVFTGLFVDLAEDVVFQEQMVYLDKVVLSHIQALYSPISHRVFLFVTHLGDPLPAILLFVSLLLAFWILKRKRKALFFLLGFLGGELFIGLLKYGFGRERPSPPQFFFEAHTPSFPSGHTFTAFLIPGLALYFFYRSSAHLALKKFASLLCALYVILMGCSRMYLGVHWFSDILGATLACLIWISVVATAYEYRGKKRPASEASIETLRLRRTVASLIICAIVILNLGMAWFKMKDKLNALSTRERQAHNLTQFEALRKQLPRQLSDPVGEKRALVQVYFAGSTEALQDYLRRRGFGRGQAFSLKQWLQSDLQWPFLYLDGQMPDGLWSGPQLQLQHWDSTLNWREQPLHALHLDSLHRLDVENWLKQGPESEVRRLEMAPPAWLVTPAVE